MSQHLFLYLSSEFYKFLIRTVIILFTLFFIVTLVEKFRIASYSLGGSIPIWDLIGITVLNSLTLITTVPEIIILLTSASYYTHLAYNREIIALQTFGVPSYGIFMPGALNSALIAVILITILRPIASHFPEYSHNIWDSFEKISYTDDYTNTWEYQFTTGESFLVLKAKEKISQKNSFIDLKGYAINADGRIKQVIKAPKAEKTKKHWRFYDSDIYSFAINSTYLTQKNEHTVFIPQSEEHPEWLLEHAEQATLWQLARAISLQGLHGISVPEYAILFHGALAKILLFPAIMLLGGATTMRWNRRPYIAKIVLFCIFVGFPLIFFIDTMLALGSQGSIPIIVATWLPTLFSLLVAVSILLYLEKK
jgi:lipopolysaccharide export system permease protein